MSSRWDFREHLRRVRFTLRWLAIGVPLGAVVGSAVAFFLVSLDAVTRLRWERPWLLYLLPAAGAAIGATYQRWGRGSERGNNLILDQIHEPGGGVPLRMAPLVLAGTLASHLCGASVGREGTAVQMGGGIAGGVGRLLRLDAHDVRLLLLAGVAAGFGAVFGTPLAGAIFAVEVLTNGRLQLRPLVPCLIAAVAGDWTTTAWGVGHTHYAIAAPSVAFDPLVALLAAVASVGFAAASVGFIELAHAVSSAFERAVSRPWLRPAVGGLLTILLVGLVGRRDFLGLGVVADPADPTAVTIQSCFQPGGAFWFAWAWKLLFTAVAVGSGLKGGEVTPLFFIGAALGHSLGRLLGLPVDLAAGLGFVAVFAGATNTPLACTLMAIELFAPRSDGLLASGFAVYAAVACWTTYLLSGRSSIYRAQRQPPSDE